MLSLFGVSHNQYSLTQLEKIVMPWTEVKGALADLEQSLGVEEALILSTCNRFELYSFGKSAADLAHWFMGRHKLALAQDSQFCSHNYQLNGEQAVRHLQRVACGLDSAILGENEVLGQLKKAFKMAAEQGLIGSQMQDLLPAVFATAKEARHQTDIGSSPVSLASLVAKLVRERAPVPIGQAKILYIGSGSLIQNITAHLAEERPAHQWVASKNQDKANIVAALGAEKINLADVQAILPQVDVVIAATASQLPLLGKGMVETALQQHPNKSMLLLDLAVPRDIEAEIGALAQVELLNLADIQSLVNANLDLRRDSVEAAERIIEQSLANYLTGQQARQMAASIKSFRGYIDDICEQELQQGLLSLRLGDPAPEVLTKVMRRFANKVMHKPTSRLREAEFAPENIHAMVDHLFRHDLESEQ